MKNSCLKVNNNKSWHWQPEDRGFGNVLGLVQSEDRSNSVTLLQLLWYYFPNLTIVLILQECFPISPKCCSYPLFAEAALLLECNPVCLTMMPAPLRKLKAVMYSTACISSNSGVSWCSAAFTEQKYRLNHMLWSYRYLHWVHGIF